jgi:uncharacterized protein (TIGR03083 family)
MSSLADRTITALRANHDVLAGLVPGLTDDQLNGPSGASEWTIAQVLSHMGSGAEIGLAGYTAALGGSPVPDDFNQGVWDRWNAMSPQEQAAGYLEHDARLLKTLEGLTADQRDSLEIDLGFLPAPVPVSTVTGMRLNESAQHSWDVRVALDPAATLAHDEAALLTEHFSSGLGFLLGFIGKADQLGEPATVDVVESGYQLVIADGVRIAVSAPGATAELTGDLEVLVRLLGGRLGPAHTPAGVTVNGNVSLDDLRRVFPGY